MGFFLSLRERIEVRVVFDRYALTPPSPRGRVIFSALRSSRQIWAWFS